MSSKVVVGTMAFKEPNSVKRIAKKLSSKIIISDDSIKWDDHGRRLA